MKAETLFELIRLAPAAERHGLLERVCAGDPELQERVQRMLQRLATADSPTQSSSGQNATSGLPPTASHISADPAPGMLIAGRYTLELKLGEGGMGEVWVAKQNEPVKRRVALKLIKAGMNSKSVVQRFEQERQALAMLDHPNIAKVLDGGLTDDRHPYFAMELVHGAPLTKFCDDARLGIRERLAIFIPICQAVQHAHQKGIIHRDLKPGNILVTLVDGKAVPKVIDFGVAKATSGRLTEESLATQLGAVLGTLEYMSPEQAGFSGEDIDTRADIYSLGVVLYELLTGLRPFDSQRLKKAAFDEVIRIIRQEEPSKPSTRLSTNGSLPGVAAARQTDPNKLASLLRGELDCVVMKCLEKQREHRYETANGLARDIQRYLADEVVEAKPPSAGYRLNKFIRRHKGQVVAAALVLFTLVCGILGTTWNLFEARHQRDTAEKARDRANLEASRATAFSSFVEQMFLSVDPEERGSRDVTVLEVVHKAAEKADKTLKNQPQVEAAVRSLLGRTLNSLGKSPEAIRELQLAVSLCADASLANSRTHSEALSTLGLAQYATGDYQQAPATYQQVLQVLDAQAEPRWAEQALQHRRIALTLIRLSRYAEAEPHILANQEILGRLPQVPPADRSSTSALQSMMAQYWKGDLEAAEKFSAESLKFAREEGLESSIADKLNGLAVIKMQRGNFDEAIPLYEEAIEIIRRLFGDVHPELAIKIENLGNAWYRKKDFAKATDLLNQVAVMRDQLFGPGSFPAARTRFNLAMVLSNQDRRQEALEIFDQVLPSFREQLGDKSTEVATVLLNRGFCRMELQQYDAALQDFQAALEIADSFQQPTGNLRLRILFDLTQLYRRQGDQPRADETMNLAISVLDPASPDHQTWLKKYQDLPPSGILEAK